LPLGRVLFRVRGAELELLRKIAFEARKRRAKKDTDANSTKNSTRSNLAHSKDRKLT